jgi:LTXXQ motif family protein
MMTMHEGMMGSGTAASAPEMAEREIKLLSARLDAMKAIAAAETALYAVLSEEQKKIGNELLSTPMMRM